jgi:membrane protease YdiL (CAAX protease family)
MGLVLMALIAFVCAMVVRRKEAFVVRWQPARHTWVAVVTGLLVFALSSSLLLFEESSQIVHFIIYILMWAVCGFAVPWIYALFIERSTPASMGLTRKRLILSLVLNIVLGGFFLLLMITEGDVSAIDLVVFGRGTFVLMIGGLFEVFLFYGFIHLRLEKAFGIIPAIVITSAIYVSWHTGTQLPMEADPLAAVWKLFLVGMMYQSVFSITRNLLAIYPFFLGGGVLIDFVVNLEGMEPVSQDFPWAVVTLSLMALCGLVIFATKIRRHEALKVS